ncbi:hypothetical protein GPALN_005387 [Globodera pallida]|nr:hypothetical protein GPALN_005387 [Globodera pallida]
MEEQQPPPNHLMYHLLTAASYDQTHWAPYHQFNGYSANCAASTPTSADATHRTHQSLFCPQSATVKCESVCSFWVVIGGGGEANRDKERAGVISIAQLIGGDGSKSIISLRLS